MSEIIYFWFLKLALFATRGLSLKKEERSIYFVHNRKGLCSLSLLLWYGIILNCSFIYSQQQYATCTTKPSSSPSTSTHRPRRAITSRVCVTIIKVHGNITRPSVSRKSWTSLNSRTNFILYSTFSHLQNISKNSLSYLLATPCDIMSRIL